GRSSAPMTTIETAIVAARGQPTIAPISRTAASWAQTNRPATTVSIDPRRAWQPRAAGQRVRASTDADVTRPPVRLHGVPRSSRATTVPATTTAGAHKPPGPAGGTKAGKAGPHPGRPPHAAAAERGRC